MALQPQDVPFTIQTWLTFDVILPLWGRRGPRPTSHKRACKADASLLERGPDDAPFSARAQEGGLWRPRVLHEPTTFFV
jgi:hypothetical protein